MTDDADLPDSTAPQSIRVVARGFKDPEYANLASEHIASLVHEIGRVIDVSSLDGITIAFDYDEALADLDRGIPGQTKMTRTANQQIVGVAKTAAVLRDGIVKSHILLQAPVSLQVLDENSEFYRTALYLIAHECGHVEEHMIRDRRFPGMLLCYRPEHPEDRLLEPSVEAIWAEYAACVVSARFDRAQTKHYAENIIKSVEVLRREANQAILAYRTHADLWRLQSEAGTRILEPLRLAAYLIGHLDGLSEDWDDVPEARRLKVLEEENRKLKKLLAEAMLDNAALKDIASGNF